MPVLLVIAWRNLWRNWRRTAIALTGIAVGLSACVLLVSWSRGLFVQMADNAVRLRLAHLAVHARGYADDPAPAHSLPASGGPVLDALAEHEGVHASPRLVGDGLVQSPRSSIRSAIVGVAAETEGSVSVVPSSIVAGAYLGGAGGGRLPPVVLGAAMAERLRVGVGDKVVIHVPGESGLGAFRVRGLYRVASSEFERSYAFVRLGDAQRLFALEGRVTEVAIALDRPEDAPELQAELRGRLARAWPETPSEVLRWQEREPRLALMLSMMEDVYWIFYAVVFVAMVFGIANVLIMAVYERTREFGVMRSIGLRARGLLAMILWESLLLTLVGTMLGLAIALPVVFSLGATGVDLAAFSEGLREYGIGAVMYPRIGLDDLWSPVGLASATALIAALWPAFRAMRLKPAQAVRQI